MSDKHLTMAIRALRTLDHESAPDWADVAETELAAYKIRIEQDAKEIAAAHNELTTAGIGQGTLPERIAKLATYKSLTAINKQLMAAVMDENTALRAQLAEAVEALKSIDKLTTEWGANRLGAVSLQRNRWQRCGDIARFILAKHQG